MAFRVLGLSPRLFDHYFSMSDAELAQCDAIRVVADDDRLPCRVSLGHTPVGSELILVNYEHQPTSTPYRSRHAIYVCRSSRAAFDAVDVVPEAIATRLVSVRAFGARHMMIDAEVVEGAHAAGIFARLLSNPEAEYLHVHNAKRGCYSARVERA